RDERFGQNEVSFISLSEKHIDTIERERIQVNNGVRFGRSYKLEAFQKREALARFKAGEASRYRSHLRRRLGHYLPHCRRAGSLLGDEPQRGTASLRLWCWRWGDNTGCKQSFAQLLPDEIADPGGINVPGQQLYRMRTRPFSLLVGALAARPAAEDRRTSTGINLEFFLAYGTARGPTPAFSMG